MLLKQVILGSFIVLCLSFSGCTTTIKVINFNEKEFYETDKDGTHFYCMSDFYMKKVLEGKIKKVNPK